MTEQQLYQLFFPHPNVKFKKTRWMILVILKELVQGKYRAIFKYYWKKSYRKDIQHLRDILSKGKLYSKSSTLKLGQINFSHEINYPKWVEKLKTDLYNDPDDYEPIKVFLEVDHTNTRNPYKWIVIDGNHRLMALKHTFHPDTKIRVRKLSYNKPKNK